MGVLLIVLVLLCLLAWQGMAGSPVVVIRDGAVRDIAARGPERIREAGVAMPRTWMQSVDALVAAHRQAGLVYAIVPPSLDAAVGPFAPGESITVDELVARIAKANRGRASWVNNVAVFEPAESAPRPAAGVGDASQIACDPQRARSRVSELDARGDSATVVELTRLAGHEDGSVRLLALAALQRIEGDFLRSTYPGRLSIFEVLADQLDHDSLLTALEGGGPVGGRSWKLAAELLGRARERVLARYLWSRVWQKEDGTVEIGLWSLGRCGDPSAAFGIRGWMRETLTNDPSHSYLAAMALGQINALADLVRDRSSPDANLRRAIAFGLGFCQPGSGSVFKELAGFLSDADASVRFVACQSLARLGSKPAIDRLMSLAGDAQSPADLRASALDALVTNGRPEANKLLLALACDPDAMVRARAADLAADIGGAKVSAMLANKLVADNDHTVRRAAVCSLARLGTKDGLAGAAAVLTDSQSDADLRIAALLGLGRSLSPEAAEPLAAIAKDMSLDTRLRNYAVLGLARLANRAGQNAIAELANTASENFKFLSLAVRHLDLETPQATAEYLIPYLTHAPRDAACAAAGRLAELGFGPAAVELLEGGDVFDNHTRMMHMWGAVRSRGREVTLAIAGASRSRRASIRKAAAFALGGRFYPEAVDAVLELARDADDGVRAAAAQSLGVTPDPAAVDVLIDMATRDGNIHASIEAARALRCREFRDLPRAREAFGEIVGTARDPGGINRETPGVAEQPAHSFALRSFAEAVEENLVANLTYESSICYDSGRDRIVQWGAHGRRYDSPQTGQTWFYDTAANRWRLLTDSRHWPNGYCCIRGTMYDAANQVVISPRSGGTNGHGWHNALRANLAHSSPWILDTRTDQWYAARPLTAESGRMLPGSHDPVHGVTLWWNGTLFAFDVYANCWLRFRPEGPTPECLGDTGGAFDPKTGQFIAVAKGSTWAFDPIANAWTDLKPEGTTPPACPMIYDSANDVMIAFQAEDDQVSVWVYHLRANLWEKLPAVNPCPAYGKIWDAAYDVKNNVTVISGTSPFGFSASLNSRETWTYRYRPAEESAAGPRPPAARNVVCVTAADGSVKVSWTPADPAAARFRVERGLGEQPWLVKWEQIAEVDARQSSLSDTPANKGLAFYRVLAVDSQGAVSRPSLPGRTTPRIVSQVTAVVRPNGGVLVRWAPAGAADVVGYNVYRAPVDLGSPWSVRFASEDVAGRLARVNEKTVSAAEFVDGNASISGPANELNWAKTFAYVVRPVNMWGVEGGPSPVALALPDPPGPVVVVPWADGRRLVLWSSCLSSEISGYTLMRMDDWHAQHVFRLQPAVLPAPGMWDGEAFPTCDRRRYYASGVDVLGAVGIPTSGAWSHGFP